VNMPLKKLQLKPCVNREGTRYSTEGGWYSCDKIRFRSGQPEKLGGWQQVINNQFLGVCRSLWAWAALDGTKYVGLGTNLKYYIALAGGGVYNDVTPIRAVTAPGDVSFSVTVGSNIMTVTDAGHGCITGDFVTFSGATGFGGNVTAAVIDQEYQVTVIDANTYTVTLPVVANVADSIYLDLDFVTPDYEIWETAETAVATYQINVGDEIQTVLTGWGGGGWGLGGWGVGVTSTTSIRIWNHDNFGEDLIFGPIDGPMYYWDRTSGLTTRGVALTSLSGASDVPTVQHLLSVSDTSRFVLAFGCNDYGSSAQDTMLIRWSDQESAVNWTPAATNQAGSVRLSHGSRIEAVAQVRQEFLVWSDTALYSLQYLGPPIVWGTQLLSDNTSIVSDRSWATAAGVTYWMGNGKFYRYDGRVETLVCDLRQYVFSDFNVNQSQQVFASTNEQFNEIWWFYCSANSTVVDRYIIYNYVEKGWYYGNLGRTAWIDTSVSSDVPMAADYNRRLLYHETGIDDNATVTTLPIEAYITSSEFDIDDGHNFGFVWRVIPDVNFTGSTAVSPTMNLTLLPLQNSGSGYTRGITPVASVTSDMSVAGDNSYPVVRSTTVPIDQYTGQVNIRVRGRQMSIKAASDQIGVQWQLGAPRIDVRQDGRKS
jgi:hypothetical protein